MVSQLRRFAWYELLTTDVAAAGAFYGKVVGWCAKDASSPELAYTVLTAGDVPVGGSGLIGLVLVWVLERLDVVPLDRIEEALIAIACVLRRSPCAAQLLNEDGGLAVLDVLGRGQQGERAGPGQLAEVA